MDIEKLKAEFEKLKYIEEKLEYLNFDEHLGCYVEKNNGMPVGLAAWVNGALYGFEQAAKAQAVLEGFVLIKDDTKTVVAIERMVEQQVEASGMDSRRLERLDGWKIIEAAVKAQEPAND